MAACVFFSVNEEINIKILHIYTVYMFLKDSADIGSIIDRSTTYKN